MVCVWGMIAAWSKNRGRAGQVNRRAPALSFKTQREEEEEAQVVRSKIGLVFSQGPLTDTKSVFVCLPGCHIKEFLCVGGSDRVYLTLQLLLCSKCPTVNAGHESHLALDRGSLFSGERGSCLEKIFNGGECGGGQCQRRGSLVCALCCIRTYSRALSLTNKRQNSLFLRKKMWELMRGASPKWRLP